MFMVAVQTSIDSYRDQRRDHVGRALRQKMVLDALAVDHLNDRGIAERTGLPINVVTGRRFELEEAGKVVCIGRRPCPVSGKSTYFYAATGVR